MGICIKSRPTAAAALLVLSGMGQTPLLADGEFILQPSLRSPAGKAVLSGPAQSKPPLVNALLVKPPLAKPPVEFQSARGPRSPLVVADPLEFAESPGAGDASSVNSAAIDAARLRAAPAAAASGLSAPRLSASGLSASGLSASGLSASGLAAPARYADLTAVAPAAGGSQPVCASDESHGLRWISRGEQQPPASASQSVGSAPPSDAGLISTATASRAAFPNASSTDVRATPSPPFSLASVRALPQPRAGDALEVTAPERTSPENSALDNTAPARAVLASRISNQIISGRPAADEVGRSVDAIDNPPGWQAIGEELTQRLGKCEALINRQAYFSAREDAETAMLYLVRVLDLMSNHYYSEPAWHAASKAMSEAEDFSSAQRLTSDSDFLRRVILSHETPVLQDADATTLAPMAAAQHYRQYAADKLVEAAQGHPWASDVLFALGRSYQSQADATQAGLQQHLRWRAITLYRGARAIAPSNAAASNQLGFVLLQMDRPADAREALLASINAAPSLAAYENLVEASRRLGDVNTSNWAMQQAVANKSAASVGQSAPEFVEVDPRTFAAMSPYSIGPNSQPHQAPSQAYRTAVESPANR